MFMFSSCGQTHKQKKKRVLQKKNVSPSITCFINLVSDIKTFFPPQNVSISDYKHKNFTTSSQVINTGEECL